MYNECWLYGMNGGSTLVNGTNDVNTILSNQAIDENESVIFKSGCMDMTFVNSGQTKVELDVYEMLPKKDNQYQSFISLQSHVESATPAIGSAPSLSLVTRGATPFQFPMTMEHFTVLKKRKYFLDVGEASTYQIRDPRNRYISGDGMTSVGFAKRGYTRGVVFVWKAVPHPDTDQIGRLTIGCTRTYAYVENEGKEKADGAVL